MNLSFRETASLGVQPLSLQVPGQHLPPPCPPVPLRLRDQHVSVPSPSCMSLSVSHPQRSRSPGHPLTAYMEVGNNPPSHLQHIVAYTIGCLCSRGTSRAEQRRNSYCFLNFTLQNVLCAYNVPSLQTGILLVLRSLLLLAHQLGAGLLCPGVLPPSCFPLCPSFLDPFGTAQMCPEHPLPLPTAGACCGVAERGARTAECHLCVPGR